jgi:hypothetical protein
VGFRKGEDGEAFGQLPCKPSAVARIAGKFLTGQWSAELKDFEAAKAADRSQSQTLSDQWRD